MLFLKKIVRRAKKIRETSEIYSNFPELKIKHPIQKDVAHLEAAMKWLCLAQDETKVGGVSALYNLQKKKWGNAYRETTGYIIPTFINYSKISKNQDFEKRALEMGIWELNQQLSDGSFGEESKDGGMKRKIFNTGQVMLGMCFLYDYTKDNRYLSSAKKSAEWLVHNQEKNGSWENHTTKGARTYHSRVAWPLLEVYKRTGENKSKISAEKNLQWVLGQQMENDWFKNCSLGEENKPWTHLVAYTIRGLLESSNLNGSREIFDSAYKSAKRMLEEYNKRTSFKFNYLPGTFDENWKSKDKYSCLTGDMQMAIIWLKLFNITKEEPFKIGAQRIINQVKETQILKSAHKELVGGIAGSFPIEGDYASFTILNWATKFFADAIMLKMDPDISLPA